LQDKDHARAKRVRDEERYALEAYTSAYTRLLCLKKVCKKVRFKKWKLVQQGLSKLGNKKMDFSPTRETTLSSLVIAPLGSPLGDMFFGDPFLLILPNLLSSNTPIPFL